MQDVHAHGFGGYLLSGLFLTVACRTVVHSSILELIERGCEHSEKHLQSAIAIWIALRPLSEVFGLENLLKCVQVLVSWQDDQSSVGFEFTIVSL